MRIALDADTLQGFVEKFLLDTYEEKKPIPRVHREWWTEVCSNHPRVALAAPRGHGKSTAINHAYGLAASLFQQHPFQLKVSRTYELAVEKLRQAKEELISNEKIKHVFRLKKLIRDTENDFIAEMSDGYQFRMMALGMEQAVRGRSWGTKRPTLIQGDDMEDDEQVLSEERRTKARRWFRRVLIPIGNNSTQFRIYGTILHKKSLLNGLIKASTWRGKVYQACDANITPASILWPEQFTQEKLLEIRQGFVDDHDLIGFNMEYRNIAVDEESGFFQRSDFHSMEETDRNKPHIFYVGGDFAISTDRKANKTAFTIGGIDPDNFLDIVEVRSGHWDGKQIVDEMISIQQTYDVDEWYVESGQIYRTLLALLEPTMRSENCFLNLVPMLPQTKKIQRARPIQNRMRRGGVRWNKRAAWYPDVEETLINFRGGDNDDDDVVDSTAWLGQGVSNRAVAPPTEEEQEDLDWEIMRRQAQTSGDGGRSRTTGY